MVEHKRETNKKLTTKRFSILHALRFGIYTYIEHLAFFLAVTLTYIGVQCIGFIIMIPILFFPFAKDVIQIARILDTAGLSRFELITNIIQKQMGSVFLLSLIVCIILFTLFHRLLTLGITKISLDFYDHDRSEIKALFSCWHLVLIDTVAALLYWIMISVGMVFFIIPGVYLLITYGFYRQAIVDHQCGVFEAFRISAAITRGAKWELLSLGLLLLLIRWISLSLFIIVFPFIMPFITLVEAYVYRKLSVTSE